MNLGEVAHVLSRRLASLFEAEAGGARPCHGGNPCYATDPHWRDLVLFHEYFDGDTGRGLGASHQTGWTALVHPVDRGPREGASAWRADPPSSGAEASRRIRFVNKLILHDPACVEADPPKPMFTPSLGPPMPGVSVRPAYSYDVGGPCFETERCGLP